jgi:hypothetical protein
VALQDYDTIRCVNYIRSEVAARRDPRPALSEAVSGGSACRPWADDRYLCPVLEDDALLFFDYDDDAQAMCAIERSSNMHIASSQPLPVCVTLAMECCLQGHGSCRHSRWPVRRWCRAGFGAGR